MKKVIITSEATFKDLVKEMKRRGLLQEVKYWETRGGDKIDITQMSDEHLINTVRYLKRRAALEDMYAEAMGSMDPMDYYD